MPRTISQNFRLLTVLQFLVGTILSVGVGLIWGLQLGASFFVGCLIMVAVLAFLALTLWLTMAKKSIAWNMIVIVIKYPVLLGSIVILMRSHWFDSVSAAFGIFSFLLAALAFGVIQQLGEKENSIGSL